ncbi:oligosaccharide flippase family protein [Vagococcus lutrae]|uniref:oligosaccharide flippase family protein n=1 Tax=Vagococcus lutrae TaxID=81947 RepID=UPI00200FC6A1|nr:oligosaccharide flippase family protein [Vagococcus lutrae]UQF24037.1 oligosaccharide flippase family protein [Vagococcus lutrae]UQF63872.1 oligosaccharide flippase family protein [Vagococcus lutrae]
MKSQLKKNFIYQFIYQFLQIAMPMITIPIVAHSLEVDGIGTYNFVTSIVNYFVLFASLGLSNYGIREIAKIPTDDIEKKSRTFWSIEALKAVLVLITLIIYFVFIIFVTNKMYFAISSFLIIASFFDISWFFYGIQDFKSVSLINILIKLLTLTMIIMFINDKRDLYIYFILQTLSVLISNICMWFFLRGKIRMTKITINDINSLLSPAFTFFIGNLSINLYTNLNSTMLGILTTVRYVGLYSNSIQLVKIITSMVGTLDNVLMPHMTRIYSENEENEKDLIVFMQKSINFQLFITIPICFGLIATMPKFVPWFFGPSFKPAIKVITMFSPLVIIMPFGTAIYRQYLMPKNKIKQFNVSVILGAIIGIILNIILIPIIGLIGAVIATFISESVVSLYRYIELKKTSTFEFNHKYIFGYIFSSFFMLIIIHVTTKSLPTKLTTTIFQVVIGVIVYMFLTYISNTNPMKRVKINDKTNNKE